MFFILLNLCVIVLDKVIIVFLLFGVMILMVVGWIDFMVGYGIVLWYILVISL